MNHALSLSLFLLASSASAAKSGIDLTAIDSTVDPCTNFYEYSCGAWDKSNPIPPDQSYWGRDVQLEERIRVDLRGILEHAAEPRADRSADEQKIGDFYASCMDEKTVDGLGVSPLKPELDRVEALKSKSELAPELALLHSIGVDALFQFGSAQDYQDARRMIAAMDQGGIGLPDRDYYLLDKFSGERADYLQHVQKMFALLGDAPERAASEAKTVLDVETALAKSSMDIVARRVPKDVHHKTPLSQLQSWTPSFDWKRYLAQIQAPAFSSLDVASLPFIKGLQGEVDRFSLEDWKVYLRWRLVHAMAPQLSTPFVEENFDFYGRRLEGQKEMKARWKRCVSATDVELGQALGKAFVARRFSPAAKQRALRMVRAIEAAMGEDIQTLPWMSAKTKEKALDKLNAVSNQIGYPDHWRDYSRLEIVRGDALGNFQRSSAFEYHRQLAKIGRPVDKGDWDMSPPTVNAEYDPQLNMMLFPAGILQPPFFDISVDDAANFGSTGYTLGHELTHAFDDEGSQYDADGNLKNWWTKADAKAFKERAQQFVEQYSRFVVVPDPDPSKEVKVNGELTLGENTADNGGLKLAYKIFLRSRLGKKPDLIDGLTPSRRFFLSYGQTFCNQMTDAVAKMLMASDPHSPPRFRLEGTLANLPAFREAFTCKGPAPKPRQVW